MSLQSLDRTQWSFAEALAHVQNVTVARRAVEAFADPEDDPNRVERQREELDEKHPSLEERAP